MEVYISSVFEKNIFDVAICLLQIVKQWRRDNPHAVFRFMFCVY
jgi:hypothetical protein